LDFRLATLDFNIVDLLKERAENKYKHTDVLLVSGPVLQGPLFFEAFG